MSEARDMIVVAAKAAGATAEQPPTIPPAPPSPAALPTVLRPSVGSGQTARDNLARMGRAWQT
eukprot:4646970-Lingulodinium_polyedra.AAC.1